jgi:hypothetical protein
MTSVTDPPTTMGIRTMTDDQRERITLLLSFQRALLGAVHQELRQASIEADRLAHRILVRFEYDGAPREKAVESGQIATTEVIAEFSAPWTIHEEHLEVAFPARLTPLKLVAYRRAEDTLFQKQPRNLTE